MVTAQPGWENTLAATCGCLTDDLGQPESACDEDLQVLRREPVISAFLERRSIDPRGSEAPIQQLRPLRRFLAAGYVSVSSMRTGRPASWPSQSLHECVLVHYHCPENGWQFCLPHSSRRRPFTSSAELLTWPVSRYVLTRWASATL